jgi:hypothetical protein
LDTICLIAAPRTGTNHLCEVLKNFPDLAPYGGLFAPEGPHGIDQESWPLLRQLTGIEFTNLRDRKLADFVHEHPTAWLDAVSEVATASRKRVLSFKINRDDLPIEVMEREILARPGLRMMTVVRRQVDSYVSWRKAVELGRWRDIDTTGMRLKLDADRFEDWLVQQERWYEHWRNILNRRFLPCPVVRYEIDIDVPVDRVLRRFASAAAVVGITLKAPAEMPHQGLVRQDKAKSIADKVTNWAEFSREIFSRGLERRAFGYPL